MKGKILCVLICILMLSSVVGASQSESMSTKSKAVSRNESYSHTILGEYFTYTHCVPCKYSHAALKKVYAGGWHPFYYITYVFDRNNNSNDRKKELNIVGTPTVAWDGGYRKDYGGSDNETDMARYNTSIIKCGNRNVKDIDLSLDVQWLGAVNADPEDCETDVPIEQVLKWTTTEMKIDVGVTNNEGNQYNGHLHVQVTEVNSSLWNDKWDDPYTFEFKDYAYNNDVGLSGGGSWSKSINWDGCDYSDADDPPHYFDYITQDNIMVIATIFDKDNNDYVDETAGFRTGDGTDPKTYDVYFGDTNPPPKRVSNQIRRSYDPGLLNFSTTYYWRIDVWDNKDNLLVGDILSFETRPNTPPNTPIAIRPLNGSSGAYINTDLIWDCNDPEGDNVTYDVYFGEYDPFEEPPQVGVNLTVKTYDPSPYDDNLLFNTKYAWRIVAWDQYGLNTTGDLFTFTTEENKPPNPASNPVPPNGANNIPGDAILYWNGSDPNPGDKLRYDVYFGINFPPELKETNLEINHYDPYGTNDMPLYKEFYWRIVTRDRDGLENPGENWTFITGVNPPPTYPKIDGPHTGNIDTDYDFTFVSTDPDGQNISYFVNWGDGTNSGWTKFHYSGEVVTLNHTWHDLDPYIIKAQARDIYDAKSNWSEFKIVIPRTRATTYMWYHWFLERFPMLERLLSLIRVI